MLQRRRIIAVTSRLLRQYYEHLLSLCEPMAFVRTEEVLQRLREVKEAEKPP